MDIGPAPEGRGRKRTRNPLEWQKAVRKRQRNSGEPYVSSRGRLVPGRIFRDLSSCCKKRTCSYKSIPLDEKETIFAEFWSLKSYDIQNTAIYGLLQKVQPKRR